MNYQPEEGTPERLDTRHVGKSVLYRLPNQAVLSSGIVEGFSPKRQYVQIGHHWLHNAPGAVLSILGQPKKRESPYNES